MLQDTDKCLVGIGSFRDGNSGGKCVYGSKTKKENKEVINEKRCHGIGNE